MGLEFNQKDYKYYNYIIEHKRNLMRAFSILCKSKSGKDSKFTFFLPEVKYAIMIHDLDKYDIDSFNIYRKKYHPLEGEFVTPERCEAAFERHYELNRHHPEHFLKSNGKMEIVDMLEMACDLFAMSIKFGGNPLEYIAKNEEKFNEYAKVLDLNLLKGVLSDMTKVTEDKLDFEMKA